jgi:phosphoserine aminotransferase
MTRAWNFSAGPAAMPEAVLKQAASEMLDWRDNGMGVMEMSHRGKAFMGIYEQAEADLRELLAVPSHFRILFMQGGGLAENAIVPLNLSQGGAMDFVLTGSWSQKSHKEAGKYGCARVAASAQAGGFTTLPDPASWQLGADSRYVHICSNETIHGIEFHELPDLRALGCDAPLVMDFSSHVASRPVNWSRVGLAFGGAQKNLGPAGLTLVIVREDLLGRALPACPSAFDYQLVADNQSMYNTPPTYSIYIAGLVLQWLKSQGGITAMEQRNIAKAQLLYEFIDGSQLYVNTVDTACRSRMNVPFFLRGDDGQPLLDPAHPRNVAFLQATQAAGLLQLKGHASVGGMRASIYNAMPIEGVQALIASMREFERTGT